MSDDGGSSGRLKEELGVMPPGDVRQCLTALSNDPELSDFYNIRLKSGKNAGHPSGNLVLATIEREYGSFAKSVRAVGDRLKITGQVLPVTLEPHVLVMDDGEQVYGESNISHRKFKTSEPKIHLSPGVDINPEAEAALHEADVIVIAPGNPHGSVLPVLAVNGMRETIRASKATVIMLANLLNRGGQTDGWHVVDHVQNSEIYIGGGAIDIVLYNLDLPTRDLLKKYGQPGDHPVNVHYGIFHEVRARAIGAHLLSPEVAIINNHDTLMKQPRNTLRHDARVASYHLIQFARQHMNSMAATS